MTIPKWIDELDLNKIMGQAYKNALYSHDPSTQNGSVLLPVDDAYEEYTYGVNNFPTGVRETPDRWERPKKYAFIEHAERCAIFNAARDGVETEGGILVCPWAACADCARAIVMAGLSVLVRCKADPHDTHDQWNESIAWGDEIMLEGGVEIIELDYKHEGKPITLRRNGQEMVLQ